MASMVEAVVVVVMIMMTSCLPVGVIVELVISVGHYGLLVSSADDDDGTEGLVDAL